MRRLQPSNNEHQWPRQEVKTIDCRKRDLVIRIANWMRDRDASGFDVECYIGGIYDWNESETFPTKEAAIKFAQQQVAKLL